ncbi:unnamed protein product [Prorocentrum cordatum]|uniref:Calpain-15 n=1 Tax=Prorocentrum cordatum TaxID=2364126 RepID=A0ABN9UW49_9DINO|nr:unnamed protein product [Polarella glacialis]
MALFDGGITPDDLLQGSIGNCWLVAALACLAEFPDAVRKMFHSEELIPSGEMVLQLFDKRCQPTTISVDEFIPCHEREWWDDEGTPLFARPHGNESWVLLVEKAFAKMLGSYRQLSGGNCCIAFRAFTGERDTFAWARSAGESARVDGEWKRVQLALGEDHFEFQPGSEERRDSDGLWPELRGYDRRSFLVACALSARHGAEHVRVDGLVEGHAYSLLRVVEFQGFRLVFLRNPWGNDKRWNGRWCDGDEAWERNPSVRARLRPNFLDDGAFWMAWGDFQASFDFIFVSACPMRLGAAADEHARHSEEASVPKVSQPARARRAPVRALAGRLPTVGAGTRVELLSGRMVEVVEWDEVAGLYTVRGVPVPYWTCAGCGEVNRRRREKCNVCSGPRSVELSTEVTRVPPEEVLLAPGTEVELRGLRHFPELNGRQGTVVAYDRVSGRYHVDLADGGGVRALPPPRLLVRRGPVREAEHGRWAPLAPWPSPVDEPLAPDEVRCDRQEELDALLRGLDEHLRLLEDVRLPRQSPLLRGQQLLPQGPLLGRPVPELRGSAPGLQLPLTLRFAARAAASAGLGPAGSYLLAILRFERALSEALRDEELSRPAAPGRASLFWLGGGGVAEPRAGGLGPPGRGRAAEAPAGGPASRAAGRAGAARQRGQRPPGAAGRWMCPDCGRVSCEDADLCEGCAPEGG